MSETADKILFNGKIITVDSDDTIAEAVAINGGRIVFVGRDADVKGLSGPDTVEIDLEGRAVTPGFVDSHNHTVAYGFEEMMLDLRYPSVRSIEDIRRLIREEAENAETGAWIRGGGWDEGLLDEKRCITRHDIDDVSPDNPVILEAQSAFAVVNGCALRLAGVDPDAEGHDGVLMSGPVSLKVKGLAYDRSVEDVEAAILRAQRGLFEVGVTTQKEAGANDTMIRAYRNLHARGELKMRSFLMVGIHNGRTSVELAEEVVSKYVPGGDDVLMLGGVKCSFDGSAANRTAWLSEEWNKNFTERDKGNYGGPIVAEPHLYPDVVKTLHGAGWQVGAHCIGDRTIDAYLDAIEAAVLDDPRRDCRHSVMHCNLPTDSALRRLAALGDNVVVEATSAYMYFVGDIYSSNFGPSRSRRVIPMRTWLERGVAVGNGCDYNTCLVNPWYGVYAACARRPLKGVNGPQPFGVDECLTVPEALRTYTVGSAYCMFWEDEIGSLEPGKYADLVVWSGDPYSAPPEGLLELRAELTMVGGEIVHWTGRE